jgi:S-layer homology domain
MRASLPQLAGRTSGLVIVAVVALVSSAIGVYAGQRFSDVPESHPFHDEILWLAEKGISTGFNDGTYRPSDAVTRQAMAAFLQRMAAGSPMEWEPNDTIAAADIFPQAENPNSPNALTGVAMGSLMAWTEDHWRITHLGGYLSASAYGLDCSDQNTSNIDLTLLDATGSQVASGDNNTFGDFCASMFVQPLAAGEYFMRVSSSSMVPWYGLDIFSSLYET